MWALCRKQYKMKMYLVDEVDSKKFYLLENKCLLFWMDSGGSRIQYAIGAGSDVEDVPKITVIVDMVELETSGT